MVEKIRKRGKKPSQRKKEEASALAATQEKVQRQQRTLEKEEGPNVPDWIQEDGAEKSHSRRSEQDAPFGYVDVEMKAYFRQVFDKLKELEEQGYRVKNTFSMVEERQVDSQTDENELNLLIRATLEEMDGKELCLATDPDTSLIVEGLAHRIGQKPLRVLMDRFAGNFATLSRHRFGSHVIQTCLTALQPAITAEQLPDGKGKSKSNVIVSEEGVLRSATQLFYDFCKEIEPFVQDMMADPFGSHIVRRVIMILSGRSLCVEDQELRSKKSVKFRSKMSSSNNRTVDADDYYLPSKSADMQIAIPCGFLRALTELKTAGFDGFGPPQVRNLAIDPVASPLLQLFIQLESEMLSPKWTSSSTDSEEEDVQDADSWETKLTNIVLDGFISNSLRGKYTTTDEKIPRSDHIESCLRDSIASHVLQVALRHTPPRVLKDFYQIYLYRRLAKFGVHPAANFVVQTVIRTIDDSETLEKVIQDVIDVGERFVKQSMVGTLEALVERCGQLAILEEKAVKAVLSAFGLSQEKDSQQLVVPVILSMRTRQDFLKSHGGLLDDKDNKKRKRNESEEFRKKRKPTTTTEEKDGNNDEGKEGGETTTTTTTTESNEWIPLSDSDSIPITCTTMQGSLLLQTILRMSNSDATGIIVSSLLQLPSLIPYTCSPISVHIIQTALLSSTLISSKYHRSLLFKLLDSLPLLVQDKYGSRIADSIWMVSDGFTKTKIVKQLEPLSNRLYASHYAPFFLKKICLSLYRKGNMALWKQSIASSSSSSTILGLRQEFLSTNHKKSNLVIVNDKDVDVSGRSKSSLLDRQLDAILDEW